ncbi:MAG: MATE family efflux transporter [Armatimonadetes bacterium]|nr:MATE family efflux transporter [Armatimonadota bacterium]
MDIDQEQSPGAEGAVRLDQRTTDLGTAALGPLMVRLSIPGMVGMLSMALYNLVDTYWVSGLPYGTTAIAALTVLMPYQMVAGAVGMGISAGVMSLVSRRFGAVRVEDANSAAGQGILLSLAAGCAFMLLGATCALPLVRALGAKAEVEAASAAFLRTVSLGFPLAMLAGVLGGMFRGAGNTFTPMTIQLWGTAVTAALDPFLIYGWCGFPRLELQGAALATIVGQAVAASIAIRYMGGPRSGYEVRAEHLRLQWEVIRDIAQVGAPAAATWWLRAIVQSITNHVLAGFGAAAVAAVGLGGRVFFLLIALLGGSVNQALTPITGYAFGARDYRRMWRAYRIAAVWTGVGGLILGYLIFAFAHPMLRIFTRDPELERLGVLSLRLTVCTFFLVEPQMMAVFSLQGMGMGGRAMWLTVWRAVLLVVPLLFLLTRFFGVTGAYVAQPVADVLALFMAAWVMVKVYRRYPPEPVSSP